MVDKMTIYTSVAIPTQSHMGQIRFPKDFVADYVSAGCQTGHTPKSKFESLLFDRGRRQGVETFEMGNKVLALEQYIDRGPEAYILERTNTVRSISPTKQIEYQSVTTNSLDEYLKVERFKDGVKLEGNAGGYLLKTPDRSFAKGGISKHLENFALRIGQDANGCERPALRKVAGLIFDMARKIHI